MQRLLFYKITFEKSLDRQSTPRLNYNKMLRKILTPDKNTKAIHIYHTSSKLIIPGLVASALSPWVGFDTFNFINIGVHSYISMSSVITDYIHKIPIKNIEYPIKNKILIFFILNFSEIFILRLKK